MPSPPPAFVLRLRRKLFGVDRELVRFDARGFRGEGEIRRRLEAASGRFVDGFHAALEEPDAERLGARLHADFEPEGRGFAFEGAGLALAALDLLWPWPRRLEPFLAGPGAPFRFVVHVGAGWACGRLHAPSGPLLARLDPLLAWAAVDGWGFHEGFFHHPRGVTRLVVPRRLKGYARRAWDQGLGRSLWFVEGADPRRIAGRIAAFPGERRGDLWAGVGLAAVYAAGLDAAGHQSLMETVEAAGQAAALAQGAAFAALARREEGWLSPAAEAACRAIWGMPAAQVAGIAAEVAATARAVPAPGPGPDRDACPAYEDWRLGVQARFGVREESSRLVLA